MEHLLLKAATTVATDQGEFEAVISTASIDRERDIVDPAGFVKALHKWIPLGKKIPLAWNHSSRAEDQIGYVDPATARVQGTEVVVKGKIDLFSDVGQHAWRMVKMGTLGFSFGYLVPPGGSTPRKGGGRHIKDADVYEITATNAPMNGDTRVLSYKAVVAPDGTVVPADQEDDDAAETPLEMLADCIEDIQGFIAGETVEGDSADVRLAERILENLQAMYRMELGQGDDGGKSVREQAEELSRQLGHKDAKAKLEVELDALRVANEEQAELLKKNEEALADAKKQLEERQSDEQQLDTLRRAGEALTLQAVKNTRKRDGRKPGDNIGGSPAEWLIPEHELHGARDGALKAVWTTVYINNLPDSAFLYIEPGGDKDNEGKTTPRSLRHFPYKDNAGAIDLPHLRNALARIPQSSLSQDVKDRLTSRAQNILDNQKTLAKFDPDVTVDATDKETTSRSVDPLVQEARAIAVKFRTAGIQPPKPPQQEHKARPELDENELRQEMHALVLTALKGSTK